MNYQDMIVKNKEWIDEVWEKLDKKLSLTSVKSRDKIPYSTKNGVHDSCTEGVLITNWTNGFWGGLMWLMYAGTGKECYKLTAERSEEVSFSIPYSSTEQYLIVAASNTEIVNLDNLNGKKIGVQQGTTSDFLVAELIDTNAVTDTTLTPYDTPSLAAAALGTKIDAVVTDKLTAEVIVASSNGAYKTFKLTKADGSDVAEVEQYGIAVGKNNTELLNVINEVLTELLANGSIAKWEQQYNDIYSTIE